MNTNCKAWFYSPDGSYYLGPVDEQKMKTLIQEGTVTRNHLVWNSSMNGWEKIENTVLAIFFGSISGFASASFASASSNAIGDESSIEEENEGGEDFQNQSGPSWDSALTKNIKTAKLINRLEKRSKNENDDSFFNLLSGGRYCRHGGLPCDDRACLFFLHKPEPGFQAVHNHGLPAARHGLGRYLVLRARLSAGVSGAGKLDALYFPFSAAVDFCLLYRLYLRSDPV